MASEEMVEELDKALEALQKKSLRHADDLRRHGQELAAGDLNHEGERQDAQMEK